MTVEWDPGKAESNRRKHGVSFADAVEVLFDGHGITIEDRSGQDEQRHVTIGADALGRILVVAHTWRDDNIRLISARKATARERAQYGER